MVDTGQLLIVGNAPCRLGIEILKVDSTTALQPLVGSPFVTGRGADSVALYRARP
jgi:hypothetical protein